MENIDFIKTDELMEAIRDLEITSSSLNNVLTNKFYWKWVIISLHMSLQGFMVCALRGSNGLNVLPGKIAERWLKAYRKGDKLPKEKLDTFLNLYEKIKSDRMIMYMNSRKFIPRENQDWTIKKLNLIRNQFIHFQPATYLLEETGLPNITKNCIDVIQFLVFDSNNIWMETDHQIKIKKIMTEINHTLKELMGLRSLS